MASKVVSAEALRRGEYVLHRAEHLRETYRRYIGGLDSYSGNFKLNFYPYANLDRLKGISPEVDEKVAQVDEIADNVEAASNILRYPLKHNRAHMPKRMRQVALGVLKGEKNPFRTIWHVKDLGQGVYGKVTEVEVGGEEYALKRMRVDAAENIEAFDQEYEAITELEGPHILKVAYATSEQLFLELAPYGTLEERLPHLDSKQVSTVLMQMAEGLVDIHAKGWYHGDLHLGNLFFVKEDEVKIGDFGLSRPIERFKEGQKWEGEWGHLPPEFYEGKLLREDCQKMDVWSFGIVLWFCLRKEIVDTPYGAWDKETGFNKDYLMKQLDERKCRALDPGGVLRELILSSLSKDPKARPSMTSVLEILRASSSV